MSISFRNISSLVETNDQERQATEFIQILPCTFTDDSLICIRQCITSQSQNGFPVHTSASTSNKNSNSVLPTLSNCIGQYDLKFNQLKDVDVC